MKKPFAITLDVGSSLANHTGSWRTYKPEYVSYKPPCNHACPAGENTQQWLFHAEAGNYEKAWQVIMEENPMPAIMGRVCYHPCETACNRGQMDSAVGINSVERFLGDEAIKKSWKVEKPKIETGKKILVVGAGPSGLSAAYHLRRQGHAVTIFEAGPMTGGMMRFGIPKYRLPREVLDAEVQRILDLGVELKLNTKVEDILTTMKDGAFDAAFLAVGAHIAKRTHIPAGSTAKILDSLSVLRSMEGESQPMLGRRVVVYGGGNTAMDVARTAKRLGATEAIVVYRRTRDKMPAHPSEVQEALEEGILIKWLSTIKKMDESEITIEKMTLTEKGELIASGEFEKLEADSLVLAIGQDVDLSLLEKVPGLEFKDGVVQVGPNMMTAYPGIFAGGDMVPSERTVTAGIGHGKKAAKNIDAWLKGKNISQPGKNIEAKNDLAPKKELATFENINSWYYSDAPKTVRPHLDNLRRQTTFEEVVGGLDESNALFEARRCLSCGNCFECDNCYGVCPDNAVIKLGAGKGFEINYDYCKGCGICAEECPCGAIAMVLDK